MKYVAIVKMHSFVKLLLLVTALQVCSGNEEDFGNSVTVPVQVPQSHPAPEESKFNKFLKLFGIGSSKNYNDPRENYSRAYQQYGYPCSVTTTTTPNPVPLLCPFPPMYHPNQRHPIQGDPSSPSSLPPPPPGLEHLPPPPSGLTSLPPPPPSTSPQLGGTPSFVPPGSNIGTSPTPHAPLPGSVPQSPFPMPPPHFPGQNLPSPIPIQSLPQPIQSGHGSSNAPNFPTFSGPLYPSNIDPTQVSGYPHDPHVAASSGIYPRQPAPVEPTNPKLPVKINPEGGDPFDPVKVNPTVVDPDRPLQVSPVNLSPTRPLFVDPAKTASPLLVSPSNDQPFVVDPYQPQNKGFSKYQQPFAPPYGFGSMNVLINPGIPEKPKPVEIPPKPTEAPLPPSTTPQPSTSHPVDPVDPLITNSLPLNDGYTIIGPIQGPLFPSQFGNNAVLIGPLPPNGIPQLPPNSNLVFFPPPPPPPSSQPNKGFTPVPLTTNETELPPKEIVSVPSSSSPSPPPPLPFPLKPQDPNGPCGNPFLRPYVPPGFRLSSVNHFIGLPPPVNTRVIYPCPTGDLLKALDFKIMRSLITSSGLLPLFEHTRNYTLFVPSDAAFRRLPRWFRDSLEVDKKLKKALVLNHLIKEDLPMDKLENEELILTARPGGNRVRINIYQPENSYRVVTVDGSEIEKGDILTTTGRVHIVNKVLMPNLPRNAAQFLSEKLEFESFWNLIKQADLVDSFQSPIPFTLFIPVNEAVNRLNDTNFFSDRDKLRNFINYHIVNGTHYSNGIINNEFLLTNYEKEVKLQVVSDNFAKTLSTINGNVRILKSDITLTNGVAHVIDRCISEDIPFYVYPQSDEFRNEYGVMKRNFRVTSAEKDISHAF